ncbi:MAG: protease inhibitor I42 family protein [Dehalococcoidia bacterium]
MKHLLRAGALAMAVILSSGAAALADTAQDIKSAAQAYARQLAPGVPIERVTLGSVIGDWATAVLYPPEGVTDPAIVIVQRVNGAWIGVDGPGTAFPPEGLPTGAPADLFWENPYVGVLGDEAVASIGCTQSAGSGPIVLQVPCGAKSVEASGMLTVTGPASTDPAFGAPQYEMVLERLGLANGPFDDWAFGRMEQDTATITFPDGSSAIKSVRYYPITSTHVLQVDFFAGDSVLRWFYLQTAPNAAVLLLKTRVYPIENNPNAPEAQAAVTLALRSVTPGEDSPSWDPAAGTPVFTDPNQGIVVRSGQQFSIALDSNPTTGYSWQLSPTPDPSVVVLVTSRYQPPASSRPGAGGVELLTFQAIGPGTTTISLGYARPWEQNTPPVRTARFSVTVQ